MNSDDAILQKATQNLPEKYRFTNELIDIKISSIQARHLNNLEIAWWKGKYISLIGIDSLGNMIVRHCSGKVLYMNNENETALEISNSVKEFLRAIY